MNNWQMGKGSQNWPKIWAGFEFDANNKRQQSIHPGAKLRRPVRNKDGDAE